MGGGFRFFPDTAFPAIAAVIFSTATAVWEDLHKIQRITKKPMNTIGFVGGWGCNQAFTGFFLNKGKQVVWPKDPQKATELGVLADLIYRLAHRDKKRISRADALGAAESLLGS